MNFSFTNLIFFFTCVVLLNINMQFNFYYLHRIMAINYKKIAPLHVLAVLSVSNMISVNLAEIICYTVEPSTPAQHTTVKM